MAFLEAIPQLRPSLHRYCSRMTGSVLDGEDIVQEALFQAYRKLDTFDDGRPLAPWLFRIAHNRCIDFLRRGELRREVEAEAIVADWIAPAELSGPALGHAVEYLVLALPPMERACVLLKDVFDYTLEEAADLVGSSIGGVKAALHRGRSKLMVLPDERPVSQPTADPATRRLLHDYVQRFNQRDWDGLRELITADARLTVADRYTGRVSDSPYFARYESFAIPWSMVAGEVDGEPVAVVWRNENGNGWAARSVVRLRIVDQRITSIVDYAHCAWVLPAARVSSFDRRS
jgi:RNA polymerase sigma-70 factor, ECF subfamily